MVWSHILLRVAAGVDHHIWCSAWGRLVSCHVPAIPPRYASASPQRFGVFSFAFANEILFARVSAGRRSLISVKAGEGCWSVIYLTFINQWIPERQRGVGGRDLVQATEDIYTWLILSLSHLCFKSPSIWACSSSKRHYSRATVVTAMLAINKSKVHVSTCVPFHWWPSVWGCPHHPDHNFTTENHPWAFPSQCLLKFQSLGPIRACSEHFLVITQSVLLTNPAHQSVITSSPPNTQMLSGHSHELVYWQDQFWLMPWGARSKDLTYQTHLSSRWWRDSWQICPHAAKDKIELKIEQNSE